MSFTFWEKVSQLGRLQLYQSNSVFNTSIKRQMGNCAANVTHNTVRDYDHSVIINRADGLNKYIPLTFVLIQVLLI